MFPYINGLTTLLAVSSDTSDLIIKTNVPAQACCNLRIPPFAVCINPLISLDLLRCRTRIQMMKSILRRSSTTSQDISNV